MTLKHLHAFIAIMAGCMLASCHSDIDLKNIDKTAEIEMGVALPVGSVHATMGDFLGANQVEQIKVDEYGIFHFMTTVDIPSKPYHQINIADYIIKDESTLKFSIAEKTGTGIIPAGMGEVELTFDMELGMEGINEDATQERIDSIWITDADFTSIINVENFDLNWSEITGVQLKLGDQFRRDVKVIDIPVSGQDFNKEIPIRIKDFTLSLMKDPSNPDAGTVNKIKFQIIFKVNPTHNITVYDDSKFAYNMRVNLIDYDAIWGWFQAGNQMRDCQRLAMDSLWDGWKDVKKLKVRFAEPSIQVTFSHKVAAPLRMYIDSLLAIDSLGHATAATWDGESKTDFDLRPTLSPYTKDLKDSVITTRIFNYESSKGHIDKMFDVRPDTFSYGFHLLVDQNPRSDYPWKQHRITKDSLVRGSAEIDVPFKFNTGSELEYTATIYDVDLSKVTLDSILDASNIDSKVKASDLKLMVKFKNRIPFDLEAVVSFLDKDTADMSMVFLTDSSVNHIHIPAPAMTKPVDEKSYGHVSQASETTVFISLDKSQFDRFAEVKHIRLNAAITNNPQRCILDTSTDLTIFIGIAAHVDAILDLNKNEKK